jgi:Yip1 domain
VAIVERVKNICLKPNVEWPVIAAETTGTKDLLLGYVLPLAAIGPAASFVGGSIIGRSLPFIGSYHVPLAAGLTLAVFSYVMAIVGIFVLAFIINALAPSFGGQKDSAQALKVAVYSYTPGWIAGALNILTALSLLAIIGGLYGLYLLYLGLPRLMKAPQEKAAGYTVVVVLCAIVLSVVFAAVGGTVAGAGLVGSGALSGMAREHATSAPVQFDKDSPLGKLQALGNAMADSNKKMAAAQKSGDPNAQAAAAMQGLGTLLGGGKHVDPMDIDQLKPFIPATFAGMPKTSGNAEKTGMAGLMISKAEAVYSDEAQKRVTLEVSDTGGASGLLGLAGWAGVQGEREDDNGFERTGKENGRLVHEKGSKQGGDNEFTIVLGDRFIVSAKGQGVELAALKTAVSGLDLAKLESMKDLGVQK